MERFYAIDHTAVVSEIIDGEAVMLHRLSGDYFSADGIGCLVWQWIGEGRSRNGILEGLGAQFAVDPAEIAAGVDSFLNDLVFHQLVREGSDAVAPAAAPATEAAPAEFTPPVLHVYSDIRNMIVLDPIHDLSEEADWTGRRRADERT